jgi:hypothetical protein
VSVFKGRVNRQKKRAAQSGPKFRDEHLGEQASPFCPRWQSRTDCNTRQNAQGRFARSVKWQFNQEAEQSRFRYAADHDVNVARFC